MNQMINQVDQRIKLKLMYNLDDIDFEQLLEKLPNEFQDLNITNLIPSTKEMADQTQVKIHPMEAANIMLTGEIAKVMVDLGLIEYIIDHPYSDKDNGGIEVWFRKCRIVDKF